MSDTSIANAIYKICCTLPGIKRIYVDELTYDHLSFELQQIQRFGVNGPAAHVIGPIVVCGVEIFEEME